MDRDVYKRWRLALVALVLAMGTLVVFIGLTVPVQAIQRDGRLTAASALDGSSKTVTPSFVHPGDVVTYSIVLDNGEGLSETTALVTDPLHPLLSYVPGSAQPAPDGMGTLITGTSGITWTVIIDPASVVTLTFQAQVNGSATDGTVLTNTATISSDGQAMARSAAVTVDLPPNVQIHSPDKGAIVTQRGSLTLSGYAWDYGVTTPFIVDDPTLSIQKAGERSYFVNWTPVSEAEYYLVQEADNPAFEGADEHFVSAPGTSYPVTKADDQDGTYYYRVRATNPSFDASRWSNVETVVVPWTTSARQREMLAPVAPRDALTVHVSIAGAPWEPASVVATAWGGWEWSYDWSPLPEERLESYMLQARAMDRAGNWSTIDTITITLDNERYFVYLPISLQRYPPVPYPPTLYVISNPDTDGNYQVSWSYDEGDPPIGVSTFSLQEAKDLDFMTDVVNYPETYNTYREITGKLPAIYYYRVRGNNVEGPGEWSNAMSVAVLPGTPVLNDIDNPDGSDTFTISWSAGRDAGSYVLEQATSSDFGDARIVYNGTATSYQASGDSSGVYYYRVKSVYGTVSSPWSNVKSVTVLPGAPVLNEIDNSDDASSYTVSWSAGRDAESYVLEQATSSSFDDASIVYNGSATSYEVNDIGSGTYYYRVKSVNGTLSSVWSNVVSVQVQAGFYDNFSNSGSGWPQATYKRGTEPNGDVMTVGYTGGTYRMKILLDTAGLNNKRMGVVKSPYVNTFTNYDVEVKHYFDRATDQPVDPTWGKGGLIFGANESYSTIYVVEWHFPLGGAQAQCAVYRYTNVVLPTSIVWTAGGEPLQEWGSCQGLKGGYDQKNHIRVEVRGKKATVYINSVLLGTFSDSGLASNHRVGLTTGSWDRTPVESRFDDFRVTPK